MMKTLILLLLLISASAAMHPPSQRNRLPLQKKHIVLQAPKNYAQRFLGMDRDTGKETYYDPRPEVVLLDEQRGKYAFKWIGYDGKEKTVIYQRPDAINAVVSARIETTGSGNSTYTYTYTIENLQSSGEELTSYFVQNFASDVRPAKAADVYVGSVSRNDKEFKDGQWIGYGVLNSSVVPGRSMEFRLESSAPPGLVECRVAGGPRGMKGVGEDMPQELENILPGYEAWPSGYTIGPIDKLKSLSPAERAKYVLQQLPRFKELGWMTADALQWYQQNLSRIDLATVSHRADQDLGVGNITNEVLLMIQGIRGYGAGPRLRADESTLYFSCACFCKRGVVRYDPSYGKSRTSLVFAETATGAVQQVNQALNVTVQDAIPIYYCTHTTTVFSCP